MPRPALAASRAIDILNLMAAAPLRVYSLTELVRQLDLNPASCHALLGAMTRDGYLVRAQRGRVYRLGPALIAIGHAALQCHPVVAAARNQIALLSAELDMDSLLTARLDDRLIALASEGPGRMPGLAVGQRVPLIPPLGTPFLAWANEREVDGWLGKAAGAIDADRLRQSLAMVRQRGYAVTQRSPEQAATGLAVLGMAEEPLAGDWQKRVAERIGQMGEDYLMIEAQPDRLHPVMMISAPVFGDDGAVLCTLSLYGFDRPLPLSRIAALGEAIARHCRAASAMPGEPDKQINEVGRG